jgi:hypothetical protein
VIPIFDQIDLRSPACVIETLERGTRANLNNPTRRGTIELVDLGPDDRMVLTGDLHDNPVHLARVVRAALPEGGPPAHLTLHELIHGDTLMRGMDFSYRVLARAAALKAAHPHHVHTLLANHELSQVVGAGIVKDGVRVVDAFNDAVEFTFQNDAPMVQQAIAAFIRSMPLAVRFVTAGLPDLLCSHSLPAPELMDRFDPSIIERLDQPPQYEPDDLTPRRGSVHLMLWGRDHTPEHLAGLAQRWGVGLFVLGHEKADEGVLLRPPNTVILNSDHARGVYLDVPARTPRTPEAFAALARRLADGPAPRE